MLHKATELSDSAETAKLKEQLSIAISERDEAIAKLRRIVELHNLDVDGRMQPTVNKYPW